MKRQLHLCLLVLLYGGVVYGQTSNFNLDSEGWMIIGDAGGILPPIYHTTGGNPTGYISSLDEGAGGTWFFSAPTKFIGNKSWFYGKTLKFDLKQSSRSSQFNDDDVIIEGNGIVLAINTRSNPQTSWTSYSMVLNESGGWRVGDRNGRRATQSEFRTVLCNVKRLWIRGEFVSGADEGSLDNVIIDGTDCTPNIFTQSRMLCSGQSIQVNGKTYNTSGAYRDTIKRCYPLCDSIIVTNLKMIDTSLKTRNLTICEGDFVKIGDSIYTKSGNYRNILRGYLGCDSTIVTNLTVNKKGAWSLDTTICSGKSVRVNNKIYSQAGTFSDTIRRNPPLCDSILTIIIKTNPIPEITENLTICKNDTIYIRGRIFNQSGVYRDTLRSLNSRCDTVIVTTVTISNLSLNLGDNITLERGDSLILNPSVSTSKSVKWKWTPVTGLNCTTCPSPVARPEKTVTYIVEARDTTGGCTAKEGITITVKACDKIFIPDAFSPNNDGNNDMFIAYGSGCASQIKRMTIFNRWGEMVFLKQNIGLNNPANGWDGMFRDKKLPSDVYIYMIEIEYGDGKVKTFSGDLTLIR